jgi:hypothetical protein
MSSRTPNAAGDVGALVVTTWPYAVFATLGTADTYPAGRTGSQAGPSLAGRSRRPPGGLRFTLMSSKRAHPGTAHPEQDDRECESCR